MGGAITCAMATSGLSTFIPHCFLYINTSSLYFLYFHLPSNIYIKKPIYFIKEKNLKIESSQCFNKHHSTFKFDCYTIVIKVLHDNIIC